MTSNKTTSVNMAADGDTCSFSPAGPFSLDDNDTLTINVGSGFPTGTKIDVVSFYSSQAKGDGTELGTWNRPDDPAAGPTTVVSNAVTVQQLGTGVKVTDIWGDASNDDDIYFGLTLEDGNGGSWNPDPELILKKKASGDLAAEA